MLSCKTHTVTGRERLHLELRYQNLPRQLAMSLHVSPFFRDANRLLLLEDHPDEALLLVNPRGDRIPPGEALEVLPAGTRIRTLRILFPSSLGPIARPLLTPSDRIWVEIAVQGRPARPPYVLVLPPDLDSEEEVVKALDRFLTSSDVASEVAELSEDEQELIKTKELRTGVGARSLELAFGSPALKKIQGKNGLVSEEWSWRGPEFRRFAFLEDGVVVKVEQRPRVEASEVPQEHTQEGVQEVTQGITQETPQESAQETTQKSAPEISEGSSKGSPEEPAQKAPEEASEDE